MVEDVVRKLGYLTLGSRLKRIGERLQADVQRLIAAQGLEVQAGQLPLLASLDLHGALTVSELVQALGITQPGVTKTISQLSELGLVSVNKRHRDQRRKTVALTPAGQALVDRTKHQLWPCIEKAVAEICNGREMPLLAQLTAIEDALARLPLDQRAAARFSTDTAPE